MVSIILPTYNGKNTVLKTLRGLREQRDFFDELIIVDDCSSDNSAELAQEFLADKNINFQIIHHEENHGLAAAYNTGIKAVKNEILIFTHQDIELCKDVLILAQFEF